MTKPPSKEEVEEAVSWAQNGSPVWNDDVIDPAYYAHTQTLASEVRRLSDALKASESRRIELHEERDAWRDRSEELARGIYKGNSIGYIYDKMTCYRDQVGFAFHALRLLGWVHGDANGNIELRAEVMAWAESMAEKIKSLASVEAVKGVGK